MTLNDFTDAMNATFSQFPMPPGDGYGFTNDDDALGVIITLTEEGLSFGEAMGYSPEKERPVIDPVDALYEACYCDADSLDSITIFQEGVEGWVNAQGLRSLLEEAFATAEAIRKAEEAADEEDAS